MAIQKTVNADGSEQLSFRSERIGARSGSKWAGVIALAHLPVSCVLTSPVMWVLYKKGSSYERPTQTLGMAVWTFAAVAVWFLVVRAFNFRRQTLSYRPGEGMDINGAFVEFKHLQPIGIATESTGRRETAYVYATPFYNKVKLTGHLPVDDAKAVVSHLQAAAATARRGARSVDFEEFV